jgi:hypothetical protein
MEEPGSQLIADLTEYLARAREMLVLKLVIVANFVNLAALLLVAVLVQGKAIVEQGDHLAEILPPIVLGLAAVLFAGSVVVAGALSRYGLKTYLAASAAPGDRQADGLRMTSLERLFEKLHDLQSQQQRNGPAASLLKGAQAVGLAPPEPDDRGRLKSALFGAWIIRLGMTEAAGMFGLVALCVIPGWPTRPVAWLNLLPVAACVVVLCGLWPSGERIEAKLSDMLAQMRGHI